MANDFPAAPRIEGLTSLDVKPMFVADRRTGRRAIFPVYHYRDDATGELILVTEDHYEAILDKLIAMGAFGPKRGQA